MKKEKNIAKEKPLLRLCNDHDLKNNVGYIYWHDVPCPFCLDEKVRLLEDYVRKQFEKDGDKNNGFGVW